MTSIRRTFLIAVLAAALLLALPFVAIADPSVTYHCEGEQTTEWGFPTSSIKEHVAQDYTVQLSNATGRYWDWKEQLWRPIHSVDSHMLVLAEETVGPGLHGWWRASIDRDTGAWSVTWAGGQHSTAIRGQCKQAPLREPPR
jgi:hypothetical protein